MNPAEYDAWYATPRGRRIGEAEYALAARQLDAQPGDSLLDVGCGTGWFSRRAAADGLVVTGLDPNPAWLDFARANSSHALSWVEGDARALPYADGSFDHVLSIAALCFIDDERRAVAECVRVARQRFAIGWLNRSSLLYWQKGRHGGSGAYRGARWHDAREIRSVFAGLPVKNLRLRSAIFLPAATRCAARLERILPSVLPWGGLMLASGETI
ncbi:class I SAM-dependent methyltransferase [Thiobacillus sp.]|uniref:class I SAM-dependent methyltransferase n=1 Tax=Thiobacillus sp. TaxID=924 RepID=UPI00286DCD9F|nr:class I SAM-dependent methyltransferase [Thiobacillus sp.]